MKKDAVNEVRSLLDKDLANTIVPWLIDHGFFDAPASINHHGNRPGDLAEHSIAVAESLMEMTAKLGLTWQNPRSPAVVGLLHDLCKLDDYELIVDHPGVEVFGGKIVDQLTHWDYRKEKIMEGHGDKSVMMASTILKLTEEEMFCIRFHMGAFTDQKEWNYYGRACTKYPNVLFTQTADMIAARVKQI
jgi:hypothetical protein